MERAGDYYHVEGRQGRRPEPRPQSAAYVEFLRALSRLRGRRYISTRCAPRSTRRLDEQRHIYLDYTGGGLYAESQVRAARRAARRRSVFGNPHSASPSSSATTALVERTRRAVLELVQRRAGDYTAVFTANATGALKLVGESYPFAPGGRLLLTFDNHNSVNGIREFARARGAARRLRAADGARAAARSRARSTRCSRQATRATPQSVRVSRAVEFLRRAASARARRERARARAGTCCSTRRRSCRPIALDLRRCSPTSSRVSFYKMFGYPTGVGCLLVAPRAPSRSCDGRGSPAAPSTSPPCRAARHILSPRRSRLRGRHAQLPGDSGRGDRPAAPRADRPRDDSHARRVPDRLAAQQLLALRHSNGRPMVRIYGPVTTTMRGGDRDDELLRSGRPPARLPARRGAGERAAASRCGPAASAIPGAGETAEGLTEEDMLAALAAGADMTLPRFLQIDHASRRQERRRDPRLARHRQQLRRRRSVSSSSPPASAIRRG